MEHIEKSDDYEEIVSFNDMINKLEEQQALTNILLRPNPDSCFDYHIK
jgi:hypothetical protein